MEVVGGGTALEYGPEDEGPHTPGPQELWQESVVLVWWDGRHGIGGMHRIGHEPNVSGGGQVSLWNNVWTPEQVLKRTATIPLREEDRPANGFNCGDDSCSFEYTDHAVWRIRDGTVEAELHVHDAHTPVDVYPKQGTFAKDVAPHHMEVGARISGHLVVDGHSWEVDGLAFRDHGWGLRDWSRFVSHRWVAGVLDNGTAFLAQTFHSSDDALVRFGCLIRDRKLTYARDVDVVVYLERDGLTTRGGFVDMTLTTGEHLHIDCVPLHCGVVSWIHGIACVDTPCAIEIDGVRGICDFETTNNALRGRRPPALAVNGVVANGLHRFPVRMSAAST